MNIYFTNTEKIDFLEARGYQIKKEKINMAYPVYHNDVEFEDKEVYIPYKNGKWAAPKPGGYSFDKMDWVEPLFIKEIKKKLLQ